MKTTILTSVVTSLLTYLIVNVLGWWIWPIIIIGGWFAIGRLCLWAEKKSGWGKTKEDQTFFFKNAGIGTAIAFVCCYWEELNKKFVPKFRNPFVWPEKFE